MFGWMRRQRERIGLADPSRCTQCGRASIADDHRQFGDVAVEPTPESLELGEAHATIEPRNEHPVCQGRFMLAAAVVSRGCASLLS
jgi:hypothetical protein